MGAVRSQSTGAVNVAKPGEPESVRCVKPVTRTRCRNDTAAATRAKKSRFRFMRSWCPMLRISDAPPMMKSIKQARNRRVR